MFQEVFPIKIVETHKTKIKLANHIFKGRKILSILDLLCDYGKLNVIIVL